MNMFPKPQTGAKQEAPIPMDVKEQPKRGTFGDSLTTEEGANKLPKTEPPNSGQTRVPTETPSLPSTAAPAGSQSLQQRSGYSDAGQGKKGKKGRGPGKGQKGGSNAPLPSSSPGVPQDGLLSAMGRLCLRGCDSSSASQPGLHMVSSHHRTESIVQSLAQVSRAWNQEKETAPPKYPLRIMLLSALLEVTIERAEAAVKPDRKDATVEAGLILDREEEPFWPFLRWNPDKREEEILSGEEMRPLEHSRLIRKLNHIRDTIHPENVLRCHGHHQITEQMQAETYRLVLEVETVGEEAQNLHEWLRLLVNCSVWKLIGGRFRRERLGRSPLANRLSELLGL